MNLCYVNKFSKFNNSNYAENATVYDVVAQATRHPGFVHAFS
jgi:hypothetical protein